MPVRTALSSLALLALATACAGPAPAPSAPPPSRSPNAAVVTGTVRASDGHPVRGAQVWTTLYLPDPAGRGTGRCGGTTEAVIRTPTDSTGVFGVVIARGLGPPFERCATVQVAPPEGSGLQGVVLDGRRLVFVAPPPGLPPRDTLRVEVSLPRAAAAATVERWLPQDELHHLHLATAVSGYAGYRVLGDSVVLLLTDTAAAAEAREVLLPLLRDAVGAAPRVVVRPARFGYLELYQWRERAVRAGLESVSIGLDVGANRLRIGTADAGRVPRLQERLRELGIPEAAVEVRVLRPGGG